MATRTPGRMVMNERKSWRLMEASREGSSATTVAMRLMRMSAA